ncbi:EGF-like domain family protein [Acanthocheilonema viteae]
MTATGRFQLLLFCIVICSIFGFEFQAKRRRKPTIGKLSLSISLTRRFHTLPKIPNIPDAKHRRQQAGDLATNFDPCKITQLCQNGGTCVSKKGAYYCQCLPTHYGKICEFLADQTSCEKNLCQNDATCYSIQQKRQIVTAMEGSDDMKNFTDNIKNFADTKVMQWVQYECWCRQGFTGSLCEYSEELRECEQDYCLHKGVGKFVNMTDGTRECDCQCQEHHTGKRCEIVLPCRDYTCFNGGICVNELILNSTNEELTYKARCNCPPRNVYGVAANFEGEQCERLTVVDNERIYDECFPCRKNAKNYASDCLDEYTQNATLQYMNEVLKACGKPCESAARFCLNGGLCDVEGHLSDDNVTSYIIPVCQCVGLDEGILCERHVNSPCDATTYDPRTPEEKCGEHGTCVGKTMHNYVCDCYDGWTGEKCDIEEPCHNHACSPGSLCVSVPIEQREKYSLGYTCLCEINQDPDFTGSNNTVKCIKTDFGVCANRMCKNDGLCYPCETSDLNNLQLCSDEEKRRGFRCLCPHGLLSPFCDKEADACDGNKCQNGAECAVDPENEFNYVCRCRLGFSGTFCEQQLSPCIMQGLQTCMMGTCVQDLSFVRGFRCECMDGYEGINCDLPKRTDIAGFIRRNYWWTYPLTVGLVLTPTVIILIVLSEDRAKREYEYKLAEKQYLEEAKQRLEKIEEKSSCFETAKTQTMSSATQSSNSINGRHINPRSELIRTTQTETFV